MRKLLDRTSPRTRYIVGAILLLLLLAGITLTFDVDRYLGGPPQQFTIIDDGREAATTTFASGRLPGAPFPISYSTNSTSYRNMTSGCRIEIERVRCGRISLGTRAVAYGADDRMTSRFFVSRWTRRPIERDVGNGLRIRVVCGENVAEGGWTLQQSSVKPGTSE